MDYVIVNGELCHYGVKGMRWGHRKKRPQSDLDRKKSAYKSAKKEYNKAYNKASGFRNFGSFSPSKKHRQASQARWENAIDKADALNKAKAEYKKAKNTPEGKAQRKERAKKMVVAGAAAAGVALAAYGAYKYTKVIQNKKRMAAAEEATKRYLREANEFNALLSEMRKGSTHGTLSAYGNTVTW